MTKRTTEEVANKVRVDLHKDQLMNKFKALTIDEVINYLKTSKREPQKVLNLLKGNQKDREKNNE